MREQLMKEIMKPINSIESHTLREKTVYTDRQCICHSENPGAYSTDMTHAMCSDMFHYTSLFLAKYPKMAELTAGMSSEFAEFDHQLMRMYDDDKAGRPLIGWKEKKACKLLQKIIRAADAADSLYKENQDEDLKQFVSSCQIWAKRLVYMWDHAFCLHELKDIENCLTDSQVDMFDNDGNQVGSLSEADRKLIDALCSMRRCFTRLLVRVPVDSNDHKYLMDKLKMFRNMCENMIG